MPEIKITFEKEWELTRRLQAITQKVMEVSDCEITRMELQKSAKTEGGKEVIEKYEWQGVQQHGHMLKSANFFVITYIST